jgi:ATP-dependent Lhr-like helicase
MLAELEAAAGGEAPQDGGERLAFGQESDKAASRPREARARRRRR